MPEQLTLPLSMLTAPRSTGQAENKVAHGRGRIPQSEGEDRKHSLSPLNGVRIPGQTPAVATVRNGCATPLSTAPVRERPRFHAARYTGSPRLQAVMKVLADGQWHTGMDIAQGAGVLNPAGVVSELNAPINGLNIESACMGENGNGRKVWRYRWVKKGA